MLKYTNPFAEEFKNRRRSQPTFSEASTQPSEGHLENLPTPREGPGSSGYLSSDFQSWLHDRKTKFLEDFVHSQQELSHPSEHGGESTQELPLQGSLNDLVHGAPNDMTFAPKSEDPSLELSQRQQSEDNIKQPITEVHTTERVEVPEYHISNEDLNSLRHILSDARTSIEHVPRHNNPFDPPPNSRDPANLPSEQIIGTHAPPSRFSTKSLETQHISQKYDPSANEMLYFQRREEIRNHTKKFIDHEFLPTMESITGNHTEDELIEMHGDSGIDWHTLKWSRPHQLILENYTLFGKNITPDAIEAGMLGDSYFLSALAALAQESHLITDLFITKEANAEGYYVVRLCVQGKWKEIELDDCFPCFSEDRSLAFGHSTGSELWVILLEKAWAKLHGSYAEIVSGNMDEALRTLTGAPTDCYKTAELNEKDQDFLWDELLYSKTRKYIICCDSSEYSGEPSELAVKGLEAYHAYIVIDIEETKLESSEDRRLLKIKNPVGPTTWKGESVHFSYNGHGNLLEEENVFTLEYSEFLKYFSNIQICKYNENYIHSTLKSHFKSNEPNFFELNITQDGLYFITLRQSVTSDYSPVWLAIGQEYSDGIQHVQGEFKANAEICLSVELTIGKYLLYAKMESEAKSLLCSYGPQEATIQTIEAIPTFLETLYIDYGRRSKKLESYDDIEEPNCFRAVELTKEGYAFIYYQNNSNKVLKETITFKQLEGLKLLNQSDQNRFEVVVAPGQEKIILLEVIPSAEEIHQVFSEISKFQHFSSISID
jgi:hypothetical protein